MAEQLAIVTIDAASDVRGIVWPKEVVGTSSSKGSLTDVVRLDHLGMDRGRAFRTITHLADDMGLEPGDFSQVGILDRWIRDGTLRLCEDGLSIGEDRIPDKILHGQKISKAVAKFGEVAAIRHFMEGITVDWIEWARRNGANGLVALDGRETAALVRKLMAEGRLKEAEIVKSFSMLVDPIEAARRRMAGRGDIKYNDPHWQKNPKANGVIVDIVERAMRDEDRLVDPVGLPPRGTQAIDLELVRSVRAATGESGLDKHLKETYRDEVGIVFDTTGFTVEEVQSIGMTLINERFLAA